MSRKEIQKHFARYLGHDVEVSVIKEAGLSQVILYRRDRLDDWFVGVALEALRKSEPDVANGIDEVIVAHYNPMEGPCKAYSLSSETSWNARPQKVET